MIFFASEVLHKTLWYPTILGILVVLFAVALFCGSIYVLLATNLGARLGFLVTFTALTGFMVILTLLWMTTASPLNTLRGRVPEWKVLEVVETPADAKTKDIRNVEEQGREVGDAKAADVKATVDVALVTQVSHLARRTAHASDTAGVPRPDSDSFRDSPPPRRGPSVEIYAQPRWRRTTGTSRSRARPRARRTPPRARRPPGRRRGAPPVRGGAPATGGVRAAGGAGEPRVVRARRALFPGCRSKRRRCCRQAGRWHGRWLRPAPGRRATHPDPWSSAPERVTLERAPTEIRP